MAKKSPTPAKRGTAPEALTPEVIDVGDANPEVGLVKAEGSAIPGFLNSAAQFLAKADALETSAKASLAAAKLLKRPTNGDEDLVIQQQILLDSAEEKNLEGHWEITAIISRFHRRLTGKRAIASTARSEAKAIRQGLHNEYVAEENRRAAREQEARRQAAEAQERLDREIEQEKLEALALQAERASDALSEREQVFVALVVGGQTGTAAASRAGYKSGSYGATLLDQPKIKTAIEAGLRAATLRQQAAAIKAAPVSVVITEVKPDVQRAAGSRGDRTTWSAEILDADAFVRAVLDGKLGIPLDTLVPDQVALNRYATAMEAQLDRWPGIRAKKKTSTV